MEDDRELGPSYKSLFLGACIIIGGTFGWWLTNFISTVEGLQKDYTQLAARVSELEWHHKHDTREAKVADGIQQSLGDRARHVPPSVP